MIWVIKNKEHTYKKCFALFPKRIGDYIIWLSSYYKTWDMVPYWGLSSHLFVYEEDVIEYIENKKES